MTYHEPHEPVVFTFRGNQWKIHKHSGAYWAHMVKYNSDTGPFSTYEQADDFIRLRGQ
jgi:hypothetical protein